MKKRILLSMIALMMFFGLTFNSGVEACASEETRVIDGSLLIQDRESTGIATLIGRGLHLQAGYSKLRVLAPGVIYAGGTTIAEHTCDSVKVSVIVERAHWDDTEWEVVDSWRHENTNADLASTSRRMEVDGGWYYRVRCVHSADGDMSSSFTDGIYVEED